MSIYKDLLDAVESGNKFKVDLIHKSLWINRKQIIKEGVIENESYQGKELINSYDLNMEDTNTEPLDTDCWGWVEYFYEQYRCSVPSKNGNNKSYFKALSVEDLIDYQLAYNLDRNLCQAYLEGYILLASLQGWLKWKREDHWFYQSMFYDDLIVLRNWIE